MKNVSLLKSNKKTYKLFNNSKSSLLKFKPLQQGSKIIRGKSGRKSPKSKISIRISSLFIIRLKLKMTLCQISVLQYNRVSTSRMTGLMIFSLLKMTFRGFWMKVKKERNRFSRLSKFNKNWSIMRKTLTLI